MVFLHNMAWAGTLGYLETRRRNVKSQENSFDPTESVLKLNIMQIIALLRRLLARLVAGIRRLLLTVLEELTRALRRRRMLVPA